MVFRKHKLKENVCTYIKAVGLFNSKFGESKLVLLV